MKTMILLLAGIIYPLMIQSNNDFYMQKMQEEIGKLNASTGIEQYQASANAFERISNVESDKWQPMYYAAYSYILMSFQVTDNEQRDHILDQSQVWIDKALRLAPDESELYVLQAFLYPSRIMVNPVERGLEYMTKAYEKLAKAKALNANNPRIYYLEATFIQNSPEAMGGGVQKALPIYQMAVEKFEQFVPESLIDPDWGETITRESLAKISR